MKTAVLPHNNHAGFTILEVVVTLIVASILGGILMEFMGHNVQKSYEPVYMAQNSLAVNEIVEKMNSDYKRQLLVSPTPLQDFRTDVINGNISTNDPYFGDYSVTTDWIRFNASTGIEEADPSPDPKVLKITVTHSNRVVTALFTK
jgi:prepilin-type N-terminal cleavage/methylation domain-containing protein